MDFILTRKKVIYFIAIISVLLLIIVTQWVSQHQISKNSRYAGVINIAGRQRMLSQKISKQAYQNPQRNKDIILGDALEWKNKHLYLQDQADILEIHDVQINELFDKITPHLQAIVSSVSQFHQNNLSDSDLQQAVSQHEKAYLQGMDRIVYLWQKEAEEKLSFFSRLELAMAGISILVLMVEYLFIFRPAFEVLLQQKNDIRKKNALLKEQVDELKYSNERHSKLEEELRVYMVKADHTNQHLQKQLGISYRQNQQLENAQKTAGIGYWYWDMKDEIQWSDQTFKIFDIPQEGKDGPSFQEMMSVIHPEDRHLIFENIEVAKAKGSTTYQYRTTDREGNIRYIQALVKTSYDDQGEPENLFGVVRDVTDEVNRNQMLYEFNEKLKKLVELSASVADTKKIEGMLAYTTRFLGMEMAMLNKYKDGSFQLEYNYTTNPELQIGQYKTVNAEDTFCSIPFQSKKLYAFNGMAKITHQFSLMLQMGIQSYIGVPLILENEIKGTMGFFSRKKRPRDFSRYEREFVTLLARIISFVMEKQHYVRKLESMHQHQENMMHIVAHDIRGPLNRLYGIIKLYPEASSDTQKELLQYVEQEYKAGSNMLDDMLNVFSLENEQQINFAPNNISEFIHKIAKKTREKTNACNLSLEVSVEDDLYSSINADMMERVINNLVDNAIKFTQQGGKIYLGLHRQGRSLRIDIKDNGIGIPKEIQHLLFQKFNKKMRRTGLRGEKSNGLGMSIVKQIIEKHHGQLELYSEGDNSGTRFSISLPLLEKNTQPKQNHPIT